MRTSILLLLAACGGEKTSGSPDTGGVYDGGSGDGSGDGGSDSDHTTDESDDSGDTAEPDACEGASNTDVVLYMSADDSNSQATPVIARATIEGGEPYSGPAFPYEFLNYYTFDYTPADAGTVRLVGGMLPSPLVDGSMELVVAAVAPDLEAKSRAPLNLVFSVDSSGSMEGENIELVRAALRGIASELLPGDRVSMVTWSNTTDIPLDGLLVSGPDDPDLLAAIRDLDTGGSTDLSQGLSTAYSLATSYATTGMDNRVMLFSDGGANTGTTDIDLISAHAALFERSAVYLVGVGTTAPSTYATRLMDEVTDAGRGAHVYVDSTTEADFQFTGERFLQNLAVSALDVRLEMTLPAGWVVVRFSGEEISTEAAEVHPQNLGSNDQMIYHLTLQNCEGKDDPTFAFTATYTDLAGNPGTATLVATQSELSEAADDNTIKAVAVVGAADAIDGVFDLPSDERAASISAAQALVEAAAASVPGDAELSDLALLLAAYSRMF
jgi:Ca-activated chloride channel homolog